jgi:hypothetical protein
VVNIHPESTSIRGMLLPFQFRTTPDDLGIRSKVFLRLLRSSVFQGFAFLRASAVGLPISAIPRDYGDYGD